MTRLIAGLLLLISFAADANVSISAPTAALLYRSSTLVNTYVDQPACTAAAVAAAQASTAVSGIVTYTCRQSIIATYSANSSSSSSSSSSTSSSTSSSSSSSIASPPPGLNHVSFQVTPTLPTGFSSTERTNGETRFVKDNGAAGSGEIFGFFWSDSVRTIYLVTSADNGKTWTIVSTASVTPYRIIALTQDSTGTVHAISYTGSTDSGSYLRITLSYANNRISGFAVAPPIDLPNHGRTSTQLRADIKLVKDSAAIETLVYSISMSTIGGLGSGTDMKVYMARAKTLSPTSSASFAGLPDAATTNDTLAFDSCVGHGSVCSHSPPDFTPHIHTALFAQNSVSRDLYLFQGPIDADYGIVYGDDSDKIYYTRLGSSNGGWSVGTTTTIPTNVTPGPGQPYGAELMSVASGTSYAWLMYIDPLNGIRFGRIDAGGTYTEASTASPDTTQRRNGWGVFSVSPDDSKIWAIWDTFVDALNGGYSGGYSAANTPIAAEGYWDSTTSTWIVSKDPGANDSLGMAGISGWTNGTAAVLFRVNIATQAYMQPTAATIWTQK